jgi:hypothetical protein
MEKAASCTPTLSGQGSAEERQGLEGNVLAVITFGKPNPRTRISLRVRPALPNPQGPRAPPSVPSGSFHLPQIFSPSFLVHPWATPHQVSYARKRDSKKRCD